MSKASAGCCKFKSFLRDQTERDAPAYHVVEASLSSGNAAQEREADKSTLNLPAAGAARHSDHARPTFLGPEVRFASTLALLFLALRLLFQLLLQLLLP
jgi:hypothetical protein